MEQFMKINTAVNGFVWGPVMLVLLVGTGIYLSIAVGFIQFTKIGYWWKNTIGKIFKKGEAGDGGDAGERLEVLLERHGDSFPSVCDCEI